MIVNIILGAIVPLILLIVAGYLIKTFRNNEVIKWVGIAVKAAEQIYTASGMGKKNLLMLVNGSQINSIFQKQTLKT